MPPSHGAPGCASAAVGSVTPDWCRGGQAGVGTTAGAFWQPQDLVVDADGDMFVSEYGLGRVTRISNVR